MKLLPAALLFTLLGVSLSAPTFFNDMSLVQSDLEVLMRNDPPDCSQESNSQNDFCDETKRRLIINHGMEQANIITERSNLYNRDIANAADENAKNEESIMKYVEAAKQVTVTRNAFATASTALGDSISELNKQLDTSQPLIKDLKEKVQKARIELANKALEYDRASDAANQEQANYSDKSNDVSAAVATLMKTKDDFQRMQHDYAADLEKTRIACTLVKESETVSKRRCNKLVDKMKAFAPANTCSSSFIPAEKKTLQECRLSCGVCNTEAGFVKTSISDKEAELTSVGECEFKLLNAKKNDFIAKSATDTSLGPILPAINEHAVMLKCCRTHSYCQQEARPDPEV